MGFVENELQDVRKLCEHLIDGSRLVACVPSMVRTVISRNKTKTITVCAQFPTNYPNELLLVELKSKTLSEELLQKLTGVCEQELGKFKGKPQVLPLLKFVRAFIDENPLSCCYDEIFAVKQKLRSFDTEGDKLKVNQKSSSVFLRLLEGQYHLQTVISVPDTYPENPVITGDVETNFPPLFQRYFHGQAKEIARKCVEPPLKKSNEVFIPQPSLFPVVDFLLQSVKKLPHEKCQLCTTECLPTNPKDAETNEDSDLHVERVYCSHLFHKVCLITYMKTPPFQGGKKCPSCGLRIYHEKWRLSDKLAEDRWAHQEARQRELEEVSDFMNE